MKKLELYQAAIACALANLDTAGGPALDLATAKRAEELALSEADNAFFKSNVNQVRATALGHRRTDEQVAKAAAQAATRAAQAKKPATPPAPGQ